MRRQVRVVGRGVSRCSHAPQLAASPGGVPSWEAFPEMNRVLVERLLGLLVGRMMAPAEPASGGGGGERGERAGEATGGAGGGRPARAARCSRRPVLACGHRPAGASLS